MNGSEQLVSKKAEVWKSRLLDVSNRNPLVRFRKHKASVLTVAMPDAFGFDREALRELASAVIAEQCRFMREPNFPPFLVTAMIPDLLRRKRSGPHATGMNSS